MEVEVEAAGDAGVEAAPVAAWVVSPSFHWRWW